MSGDGKEEGIEDLKRATREATSYKDVTKKRKESKRHALAAAKYHRKALRREWIANFFTSSALRHRKKAKKYLDKVEDAVRRISELKADLRSADGKKADRIRGKIARQERRKARFNEKAVRRESKAANRNDTATSFKIKAKTYRLKSREEEDKAKALAVQADSLEKTLG